MITKRLEAANQPDGKWTDILNQVQFVYNCKMEHSSTGMTPIQARDEKNHMKVKRNLELHSKSTRKYPEINVGNEEKIHKKNSLIKNMFQYGAKPNTQQKISQQA